MAREPKPIRWKTLLALLALALTLGSLYRFTDLGKKPMHTDEAILALKTQEYWETGTFEYDPKDYHGPFLHHAARWLGSLRGLDPATLTEEQVRWVVCIFGLLLILSPLLLMDVIGRTGAGVAALLIAVSPMMNYYSRYYIMEVPFVLQVIVFIASIWRWSQGKNIAWLFLAGIMLGWMHATKETFVLNIAALAAGYGLVKVMGLPFTAKERGYGFRSFTKPPISLQPWLIVALVALVTSMWLYSNGFKTWDQIGDSVLTYRSYLQRSGGSGHEKPWHYYLSLLVWRRQGFLWSEALIAGLGLVGVLNALLDRRRADHKRAFLTLFATYTLVLLGIYSFIPYKTPWSILSVQYALTLMAGLGARSIFRVFTELPFVKMGLALLLGGGVYNLCQQSSRATDFTFERETRYAASEMHNPYVYSHTSTNLVALAGQIHELAKHTPENLAMPMQVVQSENGWPLPWYLRDMKSVGYQSSIPQVLQAPVVVVDLGLEEAAREKLGGRYESTIWGLRPGINLSLLVERSLWEKFKGLPPSEPPPAATPAPGTPATVSGSGLAAADTVGTPVPATSPPGEAPGAAAADATMPPKAEPVEDEGPPPFVGPPYPVPTVETSPESRRSRRRS
jgi:uncharacterized protein (TIGR03663 family)